MTTATFSRPEQAAPRNTVHNQILVRLERQVGGRGGVPAHTNRRGVDSPGSRAPGGRAVWVNDASFGKYVAH